MLEVKAKLGFYSIKKKTALSKWRSSLISQPFPIFDTPVAFRRYRQIITTGETHLVDRSTSHELR